MDNYEINAATLYIAPLGKNKSYVLELEQNFIVNMSCLDIIERSCLFFGSSYEGRRDGSCSLLKSKHKVPIVIESTMDIIFFPTVSSKSADCIWVSYNNLESIEKIDKDFSCIYFKNNNQFKTNVSYFILCNQILRSKRLENELNRRKKGV